MDTPSIERRPLLFAYSTLLPLLWLGFGLVADWIFPGKRAGAAGTMALIAGTVMLLSWLFARNNRHNFSKAERWRLIAYCVIWAIILESMGLMYAASVGLVDPSQVSAVAFAVLFTVVLDTVFIWAAFNYASRRFIDSYLQKHPGKVA